MISFSLWRCSWAYMVIAIILLCISSIRCSFLWGASFFGCGLFLIESCNSWFLDLNSKFFFLRFVSSILCDSIFESFSIMIYMHHAKLKFQNEFTYLFHLHELLIQFLNLLLHEVFVHHWLVVVFCIVVVLFLLIGCILVLLVIVIEAILLVNFWSWSVITAASRFVWWHVAIDSVDRTCLLYSADIIPLLIVVCKLICSVMHLLGRVDGTISVPYVVAHHSRVSVVIFALHLFSFTQLFNYYNKIY